MSVNDSQRTDAPDARERVLRVTVTEAAAALIRDLREEHGPLMFHQSGGCCDGSAPMCFPLGEFKVGAQDVRLGTIEGCPFYMGASQFEYWKHTKLTIDTVAGRGGGFSLEAPRGVRFLTRSSLFADAEVTALDAEGPPPRGDARDDASSV
jgi:uncharacterized protein (DUF779 family)